MTIDELPRLLFGPLFVDAIKLHAVIDTPVRPYQVGPVLGHGAYLPGFGWTRASAAAAWRSLMSIRSRNDGSAIRSASLTRRAPLVADGSLAAQTLESTNLLSGN
jgi:hypothetical protein